jgi:squalene-hopene/tetraprenyl-beta-curcumene cyclase
MANLLYTLALVGHEQFQEQIWTGMAYLMKRQNADGSWNSTGYHGPFYGTYVCVRLLARVSPESEAIRSAADFLTHTQLASVGWGNALDTSLALLGLGCIQATRFAAPLHHNIAAGGLAYLHACGNDGSWPTCEFIRMDTGRATLSQSLVLSYGSRTMTTAFVLKAALNWHALKQAPA